MENLNSFSRNKVERPTKEIIDSINLNLGFGIYVTPNDFEKHVKGHEKSVYHDLQMGYICIVTEGILDFCHYGPKGLSSIRPSTFENNYSLSFCEGSYCYNSKVHEPVEVHESLCLYYGTYTGKYAVCVCDCDGSKDYGSTQEYVLLTKEDAKVLNKEV
ncbi:MAG: hypothetical protein ACRC5M_06195 [Anaeroplasmataceae bacterium]